jgi:hypothetical protein
MTVSSGTHRLKQDIESLADERLEPGIYAVYSHCYAESQHH